MTRVRDGNVQFDKCGRARARAHTHTHIYTFTDPLSTQVRLTMEFIIE